VRFSQVRLLVDDPAAAFRFYRDELGLAVAFGNEGDAYASFDTGTGTVALFSRAGQEEVVALRAAGDSTLLVLEVDDVDADVARLAARVVAGSADQPEWGGRVAYVRDPSGNLIELFQAIPMNE
jgi:catechol 2,3-dioxygenase-like lactoylglutathione lyase family enzyme